MRAARLIAIVGLASLAAVFAASCGSQHRQRAVIPPIGASVGPGPNSTAAGESPFVPLLVFRRPPRPADRLPTGAATDLAKYPLELSGGRAISAASARRVPSAAYGAWLLTNEYDAVCLLQQAPVRGRRGLGQTLSCLPVVRVLGGWLIRTLTGAPGQHGTTVEGIVPDGVVSVEIRVGGRQSRPVAVRSNAYSVTATDPESLTYYAHGMRYTVPIPGPPRHRAS